MRYALAAPLMTLLVGCGGDDGMPGPAGDDGAIVPAVVSERTGITADQLGVLVNDDDALSMQIADYYVTARSIPAANVVHLHLGAGSATMDALPKATFDTVSAQVTAALATTDVQALAITWTKPYRVDNTSITSAFAYGYKTIGDTCVDTNSQFSGQNPYWTHRDSTRPFTDAQLRPAMTIPATTFDEAKAIIDRGVASDNTWPTGSAYMMHTSDETRSARCVVNAMFGYTNLCAQLAATWDSAGSQINAQLLTQNSVMNATDVLFYVQGLASVPDLATNTYLPGAVADHLTSYGGQIPTSGQMSAFEFLRAGATGSYGTVVEPCAYTQKFPNPVYLIPTYVGGTTLIEAYWKSVEWPAEGIFIGEPLARPYGNGVRSMMDGDTLTIETTRLVPNMQYEVQAADSDAGPWDTVMGGIQVSMFTRTTITVPGATRAFYRIAKAGSL